MEAPGVNEATDWNSVIPLIQARQRDIAARSGTETARISETTASSSVNGGSQAAESLLRAEPSENLNKPTDEAGKSAAASMNDLTDAEQRTVDALSARDGEVRRHEQAHATVGGSYASAPSYTYQVGPDGKRYAIGGEVQIDVSPVPDDPAATIAKMEVVKAAALAPAEPSSADRKVASLADAQRAQAAADLTALRAAERRGEVDQRA